MSEVRCEICDRYMHDHASEEAACLRVAWERDKAELETARRALAEEQKELRVVLGKCHAAQSEASERIASLERELEAARRVVIASHELLASWATQSPCSEIRLAQAVEHYDEMAGRGEGDK